MQQAGPVRLYGKRGCPAAYAIRDFLQRSDIPFEWIELRDDLQAHKELGLEGVDDARLPICIFADGTRMERPTVRQVTEKLGWFRNPSRSEYDVAIYGAGPAGLSASVYARLRGPEDGSRRTLRRRRTGQYQPEDRELSRFSRRDQRRRTCRACARASNEVRGRDSHSPRRRPRRVHARQGRCRPRRWDKAHFPRFRLHHGSRVPPSGAPEEDRLFGAGVYYGAGASEAKLCGNEHVVMVGAGNSSAQASLHIAHYARKVTIVMRGERLNDNVSEYLVDRVTHTPNIEILPKSKVVALHGDDVLRAITIRNCETGEERTIETSFLFLCLGGIPNTQWAKEVGIVRDERGYLVTGPDLRKFSSVADIWKLNREPYYLETSMPGVFAAGDVRHDSIKRVASAVGEGAMAIAFVHRYLANG